MDLKILVAVVVAVVVLKLVELAVLGL